MADMQQMLSGLTPEQRDYVSRLTPQSRLPYIVMCHSEKKKTHNIAKKKKKKDSSAAVNAEFLDAMSEPFLLRTFHAYLMGQYCPESLVGYLRISYFEDNYLLWSKAKRIEEAEKIVEEFFLPTSENELNVSDFLRSGISAMVAKEAKKDAPDISLTIFEPAKSELKNLLKLEKFQGLHKTDEYKQASVPPSLLSYFYTYLTYRKNGRDKFITFSARNYCPNESISNSDWNILMTGGQEITLPPNEYFLTQKKVNPFIYRLVSGTVVVYKYAEFVPNRIPFSSFTLCSDKNSPVAEISTPDTILGELSILGRLPSAASVRTKTEVTLKRLQSDLVLYLFCTIPGGPQIGRKFFTSLAAKLATLLIKITSLDDVHTDYSRASFTDVIKERNDIDLEDESANDDTTQFHQRFGNFDDEETVIKSGPCYLLVKPKRKATFYITTKHICIYASLVGHKTKEMITFADLESISIPKPTDLLLHVGPSSFLLRFSDNDILTAYLSIIKSITSAGRKEEIPISEGASPQRSGLDLPSSPEGVREFIKITDNEWKILAGLELTNTKKQQHDYNAIYFPGEKITREGITSLHRVYRIVSGTCDVNKVVPDPSPTEPEYLTIGNLSAGDCCGHANFFIPSTSICSVVATSIVKVQVIDSYYLKTIYSQHPLLILKFFNHICSDISNLIIARENEGHIRFERNTKEKQIGPENEEPDNSFRAIQKRRIESKYSEGRLLWIKSEKETLEVVARLKNGFLFLFESSYFGRTKPPILVLDLFIYSLKPETTSFILLKERDTHTFRPITGYVDTWANRIRQSTLLVQNNFLRNACNEFLESSKEFNRYVLGAEAEICLNGGTRYISCTVILRMEFICVYLWKMKSPASRLNVAFGSINLEGENSILVCSDDTAIIRFETMDQRDEWVRTAQNVKQTFYFGGLALEHTERLETLDEISYVE